MELTLKMNKLFHRNLRLKSLVTTRQYIMKLFIEISWRESHAFFIRSHFLRLLTDQMANSLPNSPDFMVKIDIIRGVINENLIIIYNPIGITFSDCVSCTRTPLKQRMFNEFNGFWKLYSKITPIDLTLEIIIDSGVGPINVFLNKLLKDIPEVSLRHSNIKRV